MSAHPTAHQLAQPTAHLLAQPSVSLADGFSSAACSLAAASLACTLALAGAAQAATVDGSFSVAAYEAGADQDLAMNPAVSDLTATSAINSFGGATSVMVGNSFTINTYDASHWTLGPMGWALAHYRLHPDGSPGTYVTRQVTVEVGMNFTPGLDSLGTSYNMQGNFSIEFIGNVASQTVGGSVGAVNCIGCGGYIGGQSGDVAPDGSISQTYTLQATYEAGLDSGQLRMSLGGMGGGGGNSHAWMRLLSITDPVSGGAVTYQNLSTGGYLAAAVPEPESYGLMLAGLAALGVAARRQRAAR